MTDQQFKLLDPLGNIIAQGSLPAVMEHLPDSVARNDAIENMHRVAAETVEAEQRTLEAEQREAQALASTVQMITDGVGRLTARLDAYEEWLEREEEEAEQEEIEQMMDQLPDPDAPATFHPTGDLHTLSPKLDQGTLPNSLVKDVPPSSGTMLEPNPAELAYPSTPAQRSPVAISFQSED
jgi:hypothetical protein